MKTEVDAPHETRQKVASTPTFGTDFSERLYEADWVKGSIVSSHLMLVAIVRKGHIVTQGAI